MWESYRERTFQVITNLEDYAMYGLLFCATHAVFSEKKICRYAVIMLNAEMETLIEISAKP